MIKSRSKQRTLQSDSNSIGGLPSSLPNVGTHMSPNEKVLLKHARAELVAGGMRKVPRITPKSSPGHQFRQASISKLSDGADGELKDTISYTSLATTDLRIAKDFTHQTQTPAPLSSPELFPRRSQSQPPIFSDDRKRSPRRLYLQKSTVPTSRRYSPYPKYRALSEDRVLTSSSEDPPLKIAAYRRSVSLEPVPSSYISSFAPHSSSFITSPHRLPVDTAINHTRFVHTLKSIPEIEHPAIPGEVATDEVQPGELEARQDLAPTAPAKASGTHKSDIRNADNDSFSDSKGQTPHELDKLASDEQDGPLSGVEVVEDAAKPTIKACDNFIVDNSHSPLHRPARESASLSEATIRFQGRRRSKSRRYNPYPSHRQSPAPEPHVITQPAPDEYSREEPTKYVTGTDCFKIGDPTSPWQWRLRPSKDIYSSPPSDLGSIRQSPASLSSSPSLFRSTENPTTGTPDPDHSSGSNPTSDWQTFLEQWSLTSYIPPIDLGNWLDTPIFGKIGDGSADPCVGKDEHALPVPTIIDGTVEPSLSQPTLDPTTTRSDPSPVLEIPPHSRVERAAILGASLERRQDPVAKTMVASEFDMDMDSPISPQREGQEAYHTDLSGSEASDSSTSAQGRLGKSYSQDGNSLLTPEKPEEPGKDIAILVTRLRRVFEDVGRYKRLLACRDSVAQKLLDLFQRLLDIPRLDTSFRRSLIVATQRLSRETGLYPTCYSLKDVKMVGEHPVDAGSFADIYKGHFRGQHVCMKAIRIYQATQVDHFLKLCSKEAILWGQLSHPNVLPIYGLYRFQSRICLVSPWMDNGNINNFVAQEPTANRLLLSSDVAKGLLYLHTNGIIHGDLKGANILVTQSGRACLADFGLSSVSDTKILNWTSHSCAASKGGSMRWQAPELFDVNNDEAVHNSKASDIYAWSCVCYEIFTGEVPFASISRDSAVMLQVRSGIRPQKPLNTSEAWNSAGLTEAVWSLMEECWKEDPTKRPSISQVLSRLTHMLPIDQRSPESGDLLSPARFRLGATAVERMDLASFHDVHGIMLDLELSFPTCTSLAHPSGPLVPLRATALTELRA